MIALLIILGVILLIVEAFIPLFGMIGVSGLTLIITGGILSVTSSLQMWAAFLMALILSILIGAGVYIGFQRFKAQSPEQALIGQQAVVLEWEGKQGRIAVGGTAYHAFSDIAVDLNAGDEVQIISAEGLSFKVSDSFFEQ
ncbi:MAG: NfeD family protein [Alphaproteobacteria bacterium]